MFGFGRKWWSRLTAPKVPIVCLTNQARTIEFIDNCVKRGNSIIEPFHQNGWEIKSSPVEIVKDGKKRIGYVVDEAGITVSFSRNIQIHSALTGGDVSYNWQGVIGKCSTLDDINEGLDLGKSMKNTVIGLIIGIPIGWILTQAMK